jgi:hypothetical protein
MRPRPMLVILTLVVSLLIGGIAVATAHRPGCHRWHACPSDRGTYTCGDLGYCWQCPDHAYCRGGKAEAPVKPPAKPEALAPAPSARSHT